MSVHSPLPAIFGHATDVYKAMEKEAQLRPVDGEVAKTWEGYTTKLFQRLRLSTPYYSMVMKALREMDCVRQVRRGGGGSPSLWALIQEPHEDLWNSNDVGSKVSASAPKRQATQQVRDLNERVTLLETRIDELTRAVLALSDTDPQG